ncbi:hypothetical protein BVC80_1741g29 [Macleaya cordata]|uniref:Uncharacterized protein n=1 Tax=Macleaya cordata TaxID=56857 RepID=A0A200QKS9_MACCD|nr:hypothetical protein BVC80_1741g29 [Macleaya cordata]
MIEDRKREVGTVTGHQAGIMTVIGRIALVAESGKGIMIVGAETVIGTTTGIVVIEKGIQNDLAVMTRGAVGVHVHGRGTALVEIMIVTVELILVDSIKRDFVKRGARVGTKALEREVVVVVTGDDGGVYLIGMVVCVSLQVSLTGGPHFKQPGRLPPQGVSVAVLISRFWLQRSKSLGFGNEQPRTKKSHPLDHHFRNCPMTDLLIDREPIEVIPPVHCIVLFQ